MTNQNFEERVVKELTGEYYELPPNAYTHIYALDKNGTSFEAKAIDLKQIVLSTLHQYQAELRERIEGMRKEGFNDRHEYNQALSDILALLDNQNEVKCSHDHDKEMCRKCCPAVYESLDNQK